MKKNEQVVTGGTRRIEEVARLAGVSPITVSRTLNKPETVSEKTRAKVQEAIDKIRYVPNHIAGGLASSKSRTIGLVIPHIGNSTFADSVKGMTDILSPEGYHLLLGISGYSLDAENRNVMAFLGQRVAAMSLHGSTHLERTTDVLRHAGIPICESSTLTDKPIDMAVGYSNEAACYAMVEHLARCGYRKIAFMSAPVLNNDRIRGRLVGYTNAVKALGLFQAPSMALETPIGIASGGKAFVELMGRHPDLDAMFCADDTLAFGSMLEARRRGISIPDDVGVAGFADVELAQEFVPALTTVRLKRYEMGVAAARLLLQRLRGETPAQTIVDLGFEIIARGSTRRPKT